MEEIALPSSVAQTNNVIAPTEPVTYTWKNMEVSIDIVKRSERTTVWKRILDNKIIIL